MLFEKLRKCMKFTLMINVCLLYTSDAADD